MFLLHLFLAVSSGLVLGLFFAQVAEVSDFLFDAKLQSSITEPYWDVFLRYRWSFRACVSIPSLLPDGFESDQTNGRKSLVFCLGVMEA